MFSGIRFADVRQRGLPIACCPSKGTNLFVVEAVLLKLRSCGLTCLVHQQQVVPAQPRPDTGRLAVQLGGALSHQGIQITLPPRPYLQESKLDFVAVNFETVIVQHGVSP